MRIIKKIFPVFIVFILICLFLAKQGNNYITIEFLLDYIETFPNDFVPRMQELYHSFVVNSELLQDFVKEEFDGTDVLSMFKSLWTMIKFGVSYLSIIFEVLIELFSFIIDILWWLLQFPAYLIS